MNTIFKFLIVLIAVVAIGLGAFYYFTEDVTDTTDAFFASVKVSNTNKAYGYLSNNLTAISSQTDLISFIDENSLMDFASASWISQNIETSNAILEGEIKLAKGLSLPISIEMVKQDNDWKINKMMIKGTTSANNKIVARQPSQGRITSLARKVIHDFAVSVNQKSMKSFHDHIAHIWKDQFSVADLDNAFRAFYDSGIDITVLDQISPQLNETRAPENDGVLQVTGLYTIQPSQLHFEQKYIYEGLDWKLVGFSANIQ